MPRFDVQGPVGKAMRAMATSQAFRKVGPKVMRPLDTTLHRLTGGRFILSRLLVPSLLLTHTGARSGIERDTPLACVPDDDGGWWIVGSNFGQAEHPAWTANLIAHPTAKVSYDARTTEVQAHLLTEDEKAETWPRLVATWPAFDDYVESSGRNLRVFHLVPVAG